MRARPSVLPIGLALGLIAAAAAANTRAPVVAGRSRAVFSGDSEAHVPSYRNLGFEQRADGTDIEVIAEVTADWTRARFVLPPPESSGPRTGPLVPSSPSAIADFARSAALGAQDEAEVVARVIHAIAAHVPYRSGAGLPEQPLEVLERREANCVGLANLAVAALETLQIRARIVRGLLYRERGQRPVPHRWIEVWYPDAGWVFSDPTESINYVSPYHLVIDLPSVPDPSYDPDLAWRRAPDLGEVEDGLLVLDLRPARGSKLGERRNRAVQYQAAVRGRTLPASTGHVRLEGARAAFETTVTRTGEFAFPGLEPGRYRLLGTFGRFHRTLGFSVVHGELKQVEVRLP